MTLFFKLTILNLALCCITLPLFSEGYDEGNIHNLIKTFLPEKAVIVEAGAHHGIDTCIMSKLFPNGIIHAFEPFPSSHLKLKQAVQQLNNVKCYQYALDTFTEKKEFYIRPDNDGCNSLLPPAIEAPWFCKDTIQVDSINLDDWANTYNVKKVDFLWFDMEGNELFVLKSAPNILKTVKVIYTEINFQEFRKNNTPYYELRNYLENEGFTEVWKHCRVVQPPTYAKLENKYELWQGTALFVRVKNL